jgi:hypothetical protein
MFMEYEWVPFATHQRAFLAISATSFVCLILLVVSCFGSSNRIGNIENVSWFKLMLINNMDSSNIPVKVFGGLTSFVIDSVYTNNPELFSYPTCTADNIPLDLISSDFKVACKDCQTVGEPIVGITVFCAVSTLALVLISYGIAFYNYFDTEFYRKIGLAVSALTSLLLLICTILAGVHCIDPFQEALTEVPRAIQNPVLQKTHLATAAGPGYICEIVALVLYACVFMPTFYYSLSHEKLKAPINEPILDQDHLISNDQPSEIGDDVSVDSKTSVFGPGGGRATSAASLATTSTDASFRSAI